ncbi:sigma-70 family RNA polymerase sigma factor [Streptomyces sp. NBC_00083]|uniref:sigma-70 family RNA polymerase sigma factor n=1 Tax=Streptomyces sp. NBC_00083 TaxID=2975647 RepID=UPI002258C63E|nr:sigma-70 family RNA polymerase sigma factor [Streptomyces sp. NBC_00083]MCX5386903.1 sigma-70 family RNA polymerase sigma factor [Streptomyces sp. NBC_00083]
MTTAVAEIRRYARERDLAELQRAHGPALLRFLLGLTYGDRQRAEDLVQETLVRAWQHPEAFDAPYSSMRPWLFTVARRLAIDARRGRLARPCEVGDEVLLTTPAEGGDPGERCAAALDVRTAVRSLTPEHRAVLVQLYFRGLSVTEAADALGVPPGTVKSRSYYALRALGRLLPGYSASGPEGLSSVGSRSASVSRASSEGASATSR